MIVQVAKFCAKVVKKNVFQNFETNSPGVSKSEKDWPRYYISDMRTHYMLNGNFLFHLNKLSEFSNRCSKRLI